MNFVELATSRVAVRVEEKDYPLFAELCEAYGFVDLFGEPMTSNEYPPGLDPEFFPESAEQNTICFAHGFHGRPLNKHLSHGVAYTYIKNNFPIVEFKDFDEYNDSEQEPAVPIQMESLLLLFE